MVVVAWVAWPSGAKSDAERAHALAAELRCPDCESLSAADSQTPLAVGMMAPETKLIDQNGQSLRLADLIKQRDYVVVAFYVKAFTGG